MSNGSRSINEEGFKISYYYAIDGDDIGKKLEEYALKNDIRAIVSLSNRVKAALLKIQNHIHSKGGETIFCEGDSLLACSDELIEVSMQQLSFNENVSFSAGVGSTSALALLALKKAKGLGKSRIEIFMERPE